ncbi:low temperature requirement protein LtrA [Arthrobacter sp. GAS37]|uniref:hypothetical protein n=1 Tax=Arthrobacter sp. GAS37 TaxID=3156261 RepID=UPI003839C53F
MTTTTKIQSVESNLRETTDPRWGMVLVAMILAVAASFAVVAGVLFISGLFGLATVVSIPVAIAAALVTAIAVPKLLPTGLGN